MKNQKVSTQNIHTLGVEAAIAAAKNSKNNVLIRSLQNPDEWFINSEKFGLRKVIFRCSLAERNLDRVQTNVSVAEFKNRNQAAGQYDNKVYILVHLDTETGKNRFFCISHKDLVILQYCEDKSNAHTSESAYTIERWLCNGVGRNNIEITTLVEQGYEIWK